MAWDKLLTINDLVDLIQREFEENINFGFSYQRIGLSANKVIRVSASVELTLIQLDSTRNNLNPIELLILSSCETVNSDRQEGLGIAGIAVRVGARSTVATLWSIDDASI